MKKIWIAWEIQRRSTNLAKEFNARLFQFNYNGVFRYPVVITRTLLTLMKERPKILFVQNPSTMLAFMTCILKPLFGYNLIVDRHTLFKNILKNKLISFFDDYSLDHANLTIVTNNDLKEELLGKNKKRKIGVLADKVPEINEQEKKRLRGRYNAVFICTWAADEPYNEIIKAAKFLPSDIFVYITGKPKIKKNLGIPNFVFTGFLSREEYDGLLQSADVILDFTEEENCLVCGAYEALAVEKPLITSDTKALREYFNEGVIYTKHKPESIANAITIAIKNRKELSDKIKKLRQKRNKEWIEKFNKIEREILGKCAE